MNQLKGEGIHAVFHYVPLHSSPFGLSLGYRKEDLPVTEDISGRLLRLPIYAGITKEEVKTIERILKITLQKVH